MNEHDGRKGGHRCRDRRPSPAKASGTIASTISASALAPPTSGSPWPACSATTTARSVAATTRGICPKRFTAPFSSDGRDCASRGQTIFGLTPEGDPKDGADARCARRGRIYLWLDAASAGIRSPRVAYAARGPAGSARIRTRLAHWSIRLARDRRERPRCLQAARTSARGLPRPGTGRWRAAAARTGQRLSRRSRGASRSRVQRARAPRPARARLDDRRSGLARTAHRQPRLQRDPPQRPRWTSRRRHSNRVRRAHLTVANTGPHVPPGELERLFEPFQRLASRDDGVGLGLAIVQAVADAHDATITARARINGGLEINVAFPALN